MIALITVLICCPAIAWYLVQVNPTYRKLGRWLKRVAWFTKGKPFTCEFCTGFWLAFFTYLYFSPTWLELALVSLASGVFTFITYLRLNGR